MSYYLIIFNTCNFINLSVLNLPIWSVLVKVGKIAWEDRELTSIVFYSKREDSSEIVKQEVYVAYSRKKM